VLCLSQLSSREIRACRHSLPYISAPSRLRGQLSNFGSSSLPLPSLYPPLPPAIFYHNAVRDLQQHVRPLHRFTLIYTSYHSLLYSLYGRRQEERWRFRHGYGRQGEGLPGTSDPTPSFTPFCCGSELCERPRISDSVLLRVFHFDDRDQQVLLVWARFQLELFPPLRSGPSPNLIFCAPKLKHLIVSCLRHRYRRMQAHWSYYL
jgi:hypothetical protein